MSMRMAVQVTGNGTQKTEGPNCFAQLGAFSELPVEIRLIIWEALFCLIPSTPLKNTTATTSILSILRTSRSFYNDISCYLYTRLNHEIIFCGTHEEASWAVINLTSQSVNIRRNVADLKTLNRHIKNFPHSRTNDNLLHVSIPPSSTRDPGRIIKLSQTANSLVDAVKNLEHSPRVIMSLTGNWFSEGRRRESIRYKVERRILGGRPDTQIVLVPFCQLKDWTCDIPQEFWNRAVGGLLYDWVESAKRVLPHASVDITRPTVLHSIDSWLMDTRWFLDTALDKIQGPTADFLRRERFKYWYEDGLSWTSPYGNQLLKDLAENLSRAKRHDPSLQRTQQRIFDMIRFHHLINTEKPFSVSTGFYLAETWDSETWSQVWPHGISALTRYFQVCAQEKYVICHEYMRSIPNLRDLVYELSWWASDVTPSVDKGTGAIRYSCRNCQTRQVSCRWCRKYNLGKAYGF